MQFSLKNNHDWLTAAPEQAGLSPARLENLAAQVRGRGCVVRGGKLVFTWGNITESGDLASAAKPVLSTLMLMAIQEGRLSSPDERLSALDPRLAVINEGKDAAITWRHLASQTSGYGLSEPPGAAYAYNDYALALYFQTLMERVYKQAGTAVLASRLAVPLGFEDHFTYDTYPGDRPGRLSLSVRDFARFGQLYLNQGLWNDLPLLDQDLYHIAISSPIPANMPQTARQYTEMLPGQRSMGGTRHITTQGPGFYSFNWWLNWSPDLQKTQYPALPHDAYLASGHGSQKALWVIPTWDMVVCWSTTTIQLVDDGHDPAVDRATEILHDAVEEIHL